MTKRIYYAMMTALTLYVIVSPISTYNTLAMFGAVESSRLVALQLSITAVMILFAMVAGSHFGKHVLTHEHYSKLERRIWIAGFYIIGPPILYAYYRFRYLKAIAE